MKNKTGFLENFLSNKIAYFVTSNIHKFFEARNVLSEHKIATAKVRVDAVEIQDDNLINIAGYSVLDAVKNCGLPVFVEDAGLFIEALGGFPGPYSKFVYNTIGIKGILKLMKNVKNRNAYFMSVIAFSIPNKQPIFFIGKVKGKISYESRGFSGFGYDPVFEPLEGDGKNFGEMTTSEKNKYSHRAKALRKFALWFSSKTNEDFKYSHSLRL